MRRIRRKRSFDYVLPFLIIVGFGVVAVLAFQLWSNLKGSSGDVYFYVAAGKAKILPYGTTEWENAYSGTKLLLGDSVKTSSKSRLVLQFYNGTFVRLGDDTQVTLTDLTARGESEKIGLTLDHGMAWIKRVTTDDIKISEFEFRTAHMSVHDVGTIFEVEKNTVETVRVFKGQVKVDVLANEENRNQVSETVEVGVGQQVDLDDATLKAFRSQESPSVLMAIRDEFKSSDWYTWNMSEDENPTDFSRYPKVESDTQTQEATMETQQGSQQIVGNTQAVVAETQQTAQVTATQEVVVIEKLEAPVITEPEMSKRTTDQSKVVISGTVEKGTAKVVVQQKLAGDTSSEEYTLSRFKAGDTTFVYHLNESFGNLKDGENTYLFSAVDTQGKKSDSTEVKIIYNKPKVTEALTDPVVSTFNGTTSSTVTVGVVKVEGEIHGAEKVIVNDYTLSQFVAGSNKWVYYANENGGNLKPGLNEYEVYAIGADGKESAKAKFTITYNKPGATQEVPQGF